MNLTNIDYDSENDDRKMEQVFKDAENSFRNQLVKRDITFVKMYVTKLFGNAGNFDGEIMIIDIDEKELVFKIKANIIQFESAQV